ncbi:SigE family RNA polymerase sigma factor [soil metagenome]
MTGPPRAGSGSGGSSTVPGPASEAGWDADVAVEELYASHYRRLVRLSVLLVRDQESAEEVVQDSFVAMHGRWRSLRDPEKGLAYLRQTVVNRSRSVLRRRVVAARHAAPLQPDHRGADEDAVESERRTQVLNALRTLPERQREVLALRYYLDLSEAQIAETLGISRGAVKSHAFRGVAALRPLLGSLLKPRPEDLP